jgi:hypothetical protein
MTTSFDRLSIPAAAGGESLMERHLAWSPGGTAYAPEGLSRVHHPPAIRVHTLNGESESKGTSPFKQPSLYTSNSTRGGSFAILIQRH